MNRVETWEEGGGSYDELGDPDTQTRPYYNAAEPGVPQVDDRRANLSLGEIVLWLADMGSNQKHLVVIVPSDLVSRSVLVFCVV